MKSYSLSHVPDHALVRDLRALIAQDRLTTADLLAHLAETDARRLYAAAGYDSMFAYCVGDLRLSEEAAFRRIRAARTARQFPSIFPALADGRLNLSSVLLVAPHLTPGAADELLGVVAGKTRPAIERLLAERFPRPDLPARMGPLGVAYQVSPATVGASAGQLAPVDLCAGQVTPGQVLNGVSQLSPATPQSSSPPLAPGLIEPRPRVAPLSPGRYGIQFTFSQEQQDKLAYVRALLGHAVPSGDLAQVFERGLEELIHKLERQKFAAAVRTRPGRRSKNPRYVPAAVRRAVWQRDQGQCTFVGTNGHRCESRTRLEFDHVEPVARGGLPTVSGVRLRCRAHNLHEAERAFGSAFERHKIDVARDELRMRRASVQSRSNNSHRTMS